MAKEYCVAVAGATGAVGVEMRNTLEKRNFPVSKIKLLASSRSAGQVVTFKGEKVVIEEMTEQLAGSFIDYATGGLAAIALADQAAVEEGGLAGRLLWFVQGPISQRWKTLVQLERTLAKGADEVERRLD